MKWQPRRKIQNDPITWAYKHRKLKGKVLDHRLQPYTIEPMYESALAMEHENGETGGTFTMLKGRGVGGTTFAQTLGLWTMDTYGGTIIHAVPTVNNVKAYDKLNLGPALIETTFENITPAPRGMTATIKMYTGKYAAAYFLAHTLGGNNTAEGDAFRGAHGVPFVVFDERGQMPAAAIAVIESTTDTVPAPVFWNVGSAGYKGDALDVMYRDGSRAEWNIPCTKCKTLTVLAPYGSGISDVADCLGSQTVDGQTIYHYACSKCRGPIDPALGWYVHAEPNNPHKSYHVASMNSSFFQPFKLHKRLTSPTSTEESIMREVAGIPYGGDGLTVDPTKVIIEQPPEVIDYTIMGIDWGSQSSHITLAVKDEITWVMGMGKVDGPHDSHVPQLLSHAEMTYPRFIAADNGYQGGRNEKLNALTGCTWSITSNLHPRPGTVKTQIVRDLYKRNYAICLPWVWERVAEDIQSGKIRFAPEMDAVIRDVADVYPIKKGKSIEWVTYALGDFHYAACLTYAYAIYLRSGKKQVRTIRPDYGTGTKAQ